MTNNCDNNRLLSPEEEASQVNDSYESESGPAASSEDNVCETTESSGETLHDDDFLLLLGEMEFSKDAETPSQEDHPSANPDPRTKRVHRTNRVHVAEMECEQDPHGGYRARNGGLFEIVVDPPVDGEYHSVSVISSSNAAGTVKDLRLLRNLIIDLDVHLFRMQFDYDRMAFWKWKVKVIRRILKHPAMQDGAEPVVVPNFDCLGWEEAFLNGESVDQAVSEADERFNVHGW